MTTPPSPTPTPTPPTPPAPTDPPNPANPPAPNPTDPPAPVDWQAEAERWKKQSRENEARAKANAAAAVKLAEIEEGQKTEAQKAADRAAAAEARAAAADRRAVASAIKASATGVFADPQDAVDALREAEFLSTDGAVDEAAIIAALQDLLARKPHWKAETGPRAPKPLPGQGPQPGGVPNADAAIQEARAKGDWRTELRLQNSKLTQPQ